MDQEQIRLNRATAPTGMYASWNIELTVPTDACISHSGCRLIGRCRSVSWQMMAWWGSANFVKLNCKTTWRVQDLGLGISQIEKKWGPPSWVAISIVEYENQDYGLAWLDRE